LQVSPNSLEKWGTPLVGRGYSGTGRKAQIIYGWCKAQGIKPIDGEEARRLLGERLMRIKRNMASIEEIREDSRKN